jgi:NAD(P)-dependent dehydrogenase (short-subunit alcohol dehydrogenase family)
MGKFAGKVAVVTGGGSGIGKATAERLAKEGARVVVADLNRDSADQCVSAISHDSKEALAIACDISKEKDVQRLFSTAAERFSRVDILVSSAARFLMKAGHEAGESDWSEVLGTNVTGTALCARYAAEQMKKIGGGAIVILSSTSGIVAAPGYATYGSSKAALLMLTRSLAIDFGAWNIRVNSVSPGAVNTPALRRELERTNTSQEAFEAEMFRVQCLKRLLQPDDIARSILFLASEDASAITGINLIVDAGGCAGK